MEQKELKIGDLTLKRPIFQGGMGVGVSLGGLAGAVAAAGGAGAICGPDRLSGTGFRYPYSGSQPAGHGEGAEKSPENRKGRRGRL